MTFLASPERIGKLHIFITPISITIIPFKIEDVIDKHAAAGNVNSMRAIGVGLNMAFGQAAQGKSAHGGLQAAKKRGACACRAAVKSLWQSIQPAHHTVRRKEDFRKTPERHMHRVNAL